MFVHWRIARLNSGLPTFARRRITPYCRRDIAADIDFGGGIAGAVCMAKAGASG